MRAPNKATLLGYVWQRRDRQHLAPRAARRGGADQGRRNRLGESAIPPISARSGIIHQPACRRCASITEGGGRMERGRWMGEGGGVLLYYYSKTGRGVTPSPRVRQADRANCARPVSRRYNCAARCKTPGVFQILVLNIHANLPALANGHNVRSQYLAALQSNQRPSMSRP